VRYLRLYGTAEAVPLTKPRLLLHIIRCCNAELLLAKLLKQFIAVIQCEGSDGAQAAFIDEYSNDREHSKDRQRQPWHREEVGEDQQSCSDAC
jgi:hypothetical protein